MTRRGRELLKTDGKPMVTPCDGLRMASAVGTLILYNHRDESWRTTLREIHEPAGCITQASAT